jgi:hypothetical protein
VSVSLNVDECMLDIDNHIVDNKALQHHTTSPPPPT